LNFHFTGVHSLIALEFKDPSVLEGDNHKKDRHCLTITSARAMRSSYRRFVQGLSAWFLGALRNSAFPADSADVPRRLHRVFSCMNWRLPIKSTCTTYYRHYRTQVSKSESIQTCKMHEVFHCRSWRLGMLLHHHDNRQWTLQVWLNIWDIFVPWNQETPPNYIHTIVGNWAHELWSRKIEQELFAQSLSQSTRSHSTPHRLCFVVRQRILALQSL
jgi:hypothetical protein